MLPHSAKISQAVSIGACLLILSLTACTSWNTWGTPDRRMAGAKSAVTELQSAPPPPETRFPPDTVAQTTVGSAEWLFWAMPVGENPGGPCHARSDSEFRAKWAAHTVCANLYPNRKFYSVGGCTAPQTLSYATSEDGNFTWRVCGDPRRVGPGGASAEAARVCQSMTRQNCSIGG